MKLTLRAKLIETNFNARIVCMQHIKYGKINLDLC